MANTPAEQLVCDGTWHRTMALSSGKSTWGLIHARAARLCRLVGAPTEEQQRKMIEAFHTATGWGLSENELTHFLSILATLAVAEDPPHDN